VVVLGAPKLRGGLVMGMKSDRGGGEGGSQVISEVYEDWPFNIRNQPNIDDT
jgi:hypothetical protein